MRRRGSLKKNGARKSDVSDATIKKRIADNGDEPFSFLHGQLFCKACKENVASSAANFKSHCNTTKHMTAKIKQIRSNKNTSKIVEHLARYYAQNASNETRVEGMERVSLPVQAFRAETLEQWVGAGLAVNKLNTFRAYLEKHAGMTLTNSNHLMSTYMPALYRKELETLQLEVADQYVGVYSDGTTRCGEAFAVVVRWMDESMVIKTRCVSVRFSAGTLDAEEIAGELITVVAQHLRLPLCNVFAWMTDAANANSKAYSAVLRAAAPYSEKELCMAHTLSHVGEAAEAPYIDQFLAYYTLATAHSPNARYDIAVSSHRIYLGFC